MKIPEYAARIPDLVAAMQNADHIDVKTVTGKVDLRQFIAGAFGYQPGWMTFLYHIRGVFVRVLGMKQEGVPQAHRLRAEDVSLTPGEKTSFLTVTAAQDDRYWIGTAEDRHLNIHVGIVIEPAGESTRRFHLITIVHYNNWAGPIYFNVIRPFHHLVVWAAVHHAVKQPPAGESPTAS